MQGELSEEEGETKSRRRANAAAIKDDVHTETTAEVFHLPGDNARCPHM